MAHIILDRHLTPVPARHKTTGKRTDGAAPMPWVKVDDNLPNHPKVIRRGSRALAMFVAGICYAQRNLTNGFLPLEAVPTLLPDVSRRVAFDVAMQMGTPLPGEKVGLLEVVEGGYQVHDYLDYNPSADAVREDRQRKAEKVARWRDRNPVRNRLHDGNELVTVTGALPPRNPAPTPTPTPTPTEALESLTTLSGSAPDPPQPADPDPPPTRPRAPNPYRAAAVEVLAFLNDKTGRRFEPTGSLDPIMARLREGATVGQCKGVIAQRCRKWRADEKMAEFLRPKTLFNKTNFAQYKADLPAVEAATGEP